MAVSIDYTDGFVSITAVGGETNLDFDFPIFAKAHLRIVRTRSGTSTTLALNTDYTIADGELNQESGGTAVLVTPAIAADVYTLLLDVPEERTSDFNQAGDFLAETLNRELDLQTQMIQALRRDTDKSARLPETSTLTSLTLATPEASKLIGWNSTATGLANYASTDLSGTVVSAFIETLFNDTTASEARTTLGIAEAPFTDATALIKGSVDATKLVRFEADGLTTATTRVLTVPDRNLTIAGTDDIKVPTRQILTSGTAATYTTPATCRKLIVKMRGADGGGGGTGSSGATAGGDGGDTLFNSIEADGGKGGGASNGAGGAGGGAGGTGGTGTASLRINGQSGTRGLTVNASYAPAAEGVGGTNPLGGVGGTGGAASGTTIGNGGGGGAGEYVEIEINNPSATYTYTVGAAGTAGGAGTSGNVGTAGRAGLIIVEEYY